MCESIYRISWLAAFVNKAMTFGFDEVRNFTTSTSKYVGNFTTSTCKYVGNSMTSKNKYNTIS
jgi:hypothetical protein